MAWLGNIIARLLISNSRVVAQGVFDAWKIASKNPIKPEFPPMTVNEALQILNADKFPKPPIALLEKNYQHLMDLNNPEKGGSLYLCCKIENAKDRLVEALQTKEIVLPEQ